VSGLFSMLEMRKIWFWSRTALKTDAGFGGPPSKNVE
jgi:hypothetical protein